MSRLLWNRWLSMIVRISLGVVFLCSAWPKIADPPGFAHAIWNYRILPSSCINLLAIALPWLELAVGLALIAGVYRKGAALAVLLMMLVFTAALALNLYRKIPVDCGCFSIASAGKSHSELMAAMKMDILRDIGFFALAVQVLFSPAAWLKTESK